MIDDGNSNREDRAFRAWLVFVALVALAFMGLVAWGIVELVLHFAH